MNPVAERNNRTFWRAEAQGEEEISRKSRTPAPMASTMTPRERFLRAFYLDEPDMVPVTFSYVDPYVELDDRRKRLGYDRFHDLVRGSTDVVVPRAPRAKGIYYSSTDEVRIESESRVEGRYTYRRDCLSTPGGKLFARRKSEEDINTTWTFEGYIKSEDDVEKILSIPFEPLEVDMSPVSDAQKQLGERGIVSTGVADPICNVADLLTLRDFALMASRRKPVMRRLLDFFAERLEDYVRQKTEQSEDVLYRIVGPEYVTPPILPPSLFWDYVVPYDRRIVDIVKKSGNIACIHCHGRIGAVLDGMRRINPHVLEPIEPPPKGDVPLSAIKERLGDKTCLMGYIQYNDLEFDRPVVIRQKVRSAIDQGAAGGGYVLFPTAEPIAEISDRLLENQKAFVSAGRAYGRY